MAANPSLKEQPNIVVDDNLGFSKVGSSISEHVTFDTVCSSVPLEAHICVLPHSCIPFLCHVMSAGPDDQSADRDAESGVPAVSCREVGSKPKNLRCIESKT